MVGSQRKVIENKNVGEDNSRQAMVEAHGTETDSPQFLLYGTNGYTGELTARLAVERGLKPILAGRNADAIRSLADQLDLPWRTFSLDEPGSIDAAIADVVVVLHCAGPFWRTSSPMVDSCLRTGTHYLDITGEIEVFEALARRNDEACSANVMLLPGAGFDVVPTDCLAAHLHQKLPTATHLMLAFNTVGGFSRGTLTTAIEQMGRGASGMVRRDGALVSVPPVWKTREVDFGNGPTQAMTIPWGDVATAYHSTGIPNIEVYMAAPKPMIQFAKFGQLASRPMRFRTVQNVVIKCIGLGTTGPSTSARHKGEAFVWGMVKDEGSGEKAEATLHTPETYTLTALASLSMVERILGGNAPSGYQTPASAYGADFVLTIEGVDRTDG